MTVATPILNARSHLRSAGLRVTQPRLAVWEALRAGAHLSADEVFRRVVEIVPRTSLQSVYNALSDFAGAELVRCIEPAGYPRLYELRVRDNHHHLICTGCGAVTDVDCAEGAAPCLRASGAHGYQIAEAEVTFWGTCPECAALPATPATHTDLAQ